MNTQVICLPTARAPSAATTEESTPPDRARITRSSPTFAELGRHGLDQVVHAPVGLQTADLKQEVAQQLLTVLGVLDLGWNCVVKIFALDALHGGNRAHVGAGGNGKALGYLGHGVTVAHPHGLLHRRGVKELGTSRAS